MMWTVGMADRDPEKNRHPASPQATASTSNRAPPGHDDAARALNGSGDGHSPRQQYQPQDADERMCYFSPEKHWLAVFCISLANIKHAVNCQ